MSKPVAPLSPAVVSGNHIFTSGQICFDADGTLHNVSIEEETHQTMKNLQHILESNRVGFESVVKASIYITDMSFYQQVSDVYATYFHQKFPAREVICVKALPFKARVEISMVAENQPKA